MNKINTKQKMKKIFVYAEHTAQSQANSGVQRVVRGLARALQGQVDEVVFVRWCPESLSLVRLNEFQLSHLEQWEGPIADLEAAGNDSIHLDARDKKSLTNGWLLIPEVTHITFQESPPTEGILLYARRFGMKTAAILYDLIPLKREEYIASRHVHSAYLQYLVLVDFIIPISASVAADLRHFFNNTATTAEFLYPVIRDVLLPHELPGLQRQFFAEPAAATLTILCVGTVEPRKNQITLIDAYANFRVRHPNIRCKLKIVGNVHPIVEERLNHLSSSVPGLEILNFVPDNQVVELYRQAAFSVFPSVEEGYGLPIAESLWLGVPCLCAGHGSMAEIAVGGGALCVDTRDKDALYHGLEKMLLDADLRAALRLEAATRTLSTWSSYAQTLIEQLNNVPGISRALVWVNSTVAYHGNSGVQRVVRQLTASLEKIGVSLTYVAWDAELGDFRMINAEELTHLSLWNGPVKNNFISLHQDLKDSWLIIPELVLPNPNAEMVIGAAKRRGIRVATVFYDLIPVTLTEIYPPEAQAGYHLFFKMISQSDLLIPISRTIGDDLWKYYCQHLDRLTTIKHRIHSLPLPGEMRTFPRCVELRSPKVVLSQVSILMVGTMEPRKNHLVAIHGFRLARKILRERGSKLQLKLTFAGSTKDYVHYAQAILAEVDSDPDIAVVELPTDETLSRLYEDCDFTIFPSELEGFGLPVLESLWHGRPCICSNVGAIAEVAHGGGCVTFDPHDGDILGEYIARLASDPQELKALTMKVIERPIKSWDEYAKDLSWLIRREQPTFPSSLERHFPIWRAAHTKRTGGFKLSVCVSTYNRADWLQHSLRQIIRSVNLHLEGVEILVVDNASTDRTPEVMEEFISLPNLRYHRNDVNVGMLGNLAVTSKLAGGDYVWILGDDDLIREGSVRMIMDIIRDYPRLEIIYLNYSYTYFDSPEELDAVDEVIFKSVPIAAPSKNHFCEEVCHFAGYNENLFTAIYACVFRRDHAIGAYTQDTSGPPFSDLMTCIPTSVYVLNHLVNRPGYWVGDPYVIVNMNVSWRKWVLIWHLERMPDLFDLAEKQGVNTDLLAPYRRNHCMDVANWARDVYFGEDDSLPELFSMQRLIERCKHIPEFQAQIDELRHIYDLAYLQNRVVADNKTPWELFQSFNLVNLSI